MRTRLSIPIQLLSGWTWEPIYKIVNMSFGPRFRKISLAVLYSCCGGESMKWEILNVVGGDYYDLGTVDHRTNLNWHERSALGGRLATTLVAAISAVILFLFYFYSVFFSSPSSPFLIEGVLGSKNLFSESCLKWPIT